MSIRYASVHVLRPDQPLAAQVVLHLPSADVTHVTIERADGTTLRYALTFQEELEPHQGTKLIPRFDWSRPEVNGGLDRAGDDPT